MLSKALMDQYYRNGKDDKEASLHSEEAAFP